MKLRRTLAALAALAMLGAIAAREWPSPVPDFDAVRARYVESDAYLLDRHGQVLDSVRIDRGTRRLPWVPIDAISPALRDAVISGEDRRFAEHDGVDWLGAMGALRDWLVHDRRRGASTITMQVAMLIDGTPHVREGAAAVSRKLLQARRASWLESHWTKDQILEAYLNLAQFRGELQGIGAASALLARKAPSGLSVPESLVLAALLPQPSASPETVAERACARVLARGIDVPCAGIERASAALLDKLPAASTGPDLAPQLAHALLARAGEQVATTLDASIQKLARDVLARQLAELVDRNVRDGAVIVVDNASGEVLAYVGSAGPASTAASVDGVRARRQAGSTLKPFLYELAIERRYLTAASLLDDSAIRLETTSGTYIPQDYDHDFKGLVSVRTALGSSLNVPAVRALVLTGVEPFRDRLHALGYAGLTQDGSFYGFALALGSAEVSLWEQAQAYRALALGGAWSPLVLRPGSALPPQPLLAADASFVVADMMSDRAARALTFGLDNHLNTGFWSAVKTGTSKDMRDNWCVGFSSRWTVAAWVGNFEGDSMHEVSGVTGAAPVWREVMEALHAGVESRAPVAPPGVVRVATDFTPRVEPPRREWFLEGTHDERVVAIAQREGIARIATPANGMIIALDPDIPSMYQRITLTARGARADARFVLDGKPLGAADRDVLWAPVTGAHRLAIEDAKGGELDRVLFVVR